MLQPADQPMIAPADQAAYEAKADIVVFDTAFFAQSAPNTAKDMIDRLPGFSLSNGLSLRGFGGAAGNVLINGQRPSSKSESLADILDAIPARSVVRVELIRGGARGIDMQGQSQLANVVIAKAASDVITTSAGLKAYADGQVTPAAQLDWSRRDGAVALTGSLQAFVDQSSNAGRGHVSVRTPAGGLATNGRARVRYPTEGYRARGAAELPLADGVLRMNVRAALDRYDSDETYDLTVAQSGARRMDKIVQNSDVPSAEVGGDFTRAFGATELKGLVLQSYKLERYASETSQAGVQSDFRQRTKSGESIARLTASYRPDQQLSLLTGGELAFNFRDGRSAYRVGGVALVIPSANVRVEEVRGEAFARINLIASSRVSIESEARLERSRISQKGDSNRSTDFQFLKPRIQLTYAAAPGLEARIRVEREVSQLNFADYVSSADFNSGIGVSAGNAALAPEKRWLFEAVLDRRLSADSAITFTARQFLLRDVIDQIPVGAFSAPGNIGAGTRTYAMIAVTLPLRAVGLPGGRLKAEPAFTMSQVTDPTTRQKRRISNEQMVSGTLSVTNDMPRLKSTWQFDLYSPQRIESYRTNQIIKNRQDVWLNWLWDYKPKPDISYLFELHNFTSRGRERQRLVYAQLRTETGQFSEEQLNLKWGPYVYLRIRKSW